MKQGLIKKILEEVSENFQGIKKGAIRIAKGEATEAIQKEASQIAGIKGKTILEEAGKVKEFDKVFKSLMGSETFYKNKKNIFKQMDLIAPDAAITRNRILDNLASGNNNEAFSILKSMNIESDDIISMVSSGKLDDALMLAERKTTDVQYESYINYFKESVKDFHTPEYIEKVIGSQKTLAQKANAAMNLQMAKAEVSEAIGLFKKKGLFQKTLGLAKNTQAIVGDAYEEFASKGHTMLAKVTEQFYDCINYAGDFKHRSKAMLNDLSNDINKLQDKGNGVRSYLDSLSAPGVKLEPIRLSNGLQVLANKRALQYLTKDGKLQENELMLAFKHDNIMAQHAMVYGEMAKGTFDINKMARSYEDVPVDKFIRMQKTSDFDFGLGYTHTVPTEQYLQEITADDHIAKTLSSLADKPFQQGSFFTAAKIKPTSKLRFTPENRLSFADEINHYASQFSGTVVKRFGDKKLHEIMAIGMLDMRKSNGVDLGRPMQDIIKPMKQSWESIFKTKSPEDMLPGEKLFNQYMGLNVTMALSSPRMAIFNSFQDLLNGANWRGFTNTFSSSLYTKSKFVTEVAKNKGNMKEAFLNMAKNDKDSVFSKAFERFYLESPELASNAYEGLLVNDSKAQKFYDFATTLFRGSDKVSRYGTFYSSHKFANNLVNDFAKMPKTKDAILDLYKKGHLYEFDAPIRRRLSELMVDGKYEEFAYQYARAATRTEIFDYSKIGSPTIKNLANSASPVLGMTLSLTSWPMYYTRILTGAAKAFNNGDKKPLAMLGLFGMTFYAGAQMAAHSDDETVSSLGKYALRRTPGFMPAIQMQDFFYKEPLGLLSPLGKLPMLPIVAGMKYAEDIMYPDDKVITEYDRQYYNAIDKLKNSLMANKVKQGIDLVNLVDEFTDVFE